MLHTKKTSQLLQRPVIVCFLALLCTALWGSAFPCIKTGYRLFHIASEDTASQLLFAGVRFFLAGILVILFGSFLQRKVLLFRKSALPKIGVVSLFQTILQYVFFYIGLAHTTAVKSSIFGGTGVLFSILFVCLIFRQEKLTFSKLAGCILGFSGIFLISFQNFRSLDFVERRGRSFDLQYRQCALPYFPEKVFQDGEFSDAQRISIFIWRSLYFCYRCACRRTPVISRLLPCPVDDLHGNDFCGRLYRLGNSAAI